MNALTEVLPWLALIVAILCLGIVIGDWLDSRGYTRGIGDL